MRSRSSGFIDIWRILVCHLYLTYGRKPRIPAYDYEKKDLFNRGLLFRDEEKKLEYPVPQQILNCEVSTPNKNRMLLEPKVEEELMIEPRISVWRPFSICC